jgi:hypothetical protein
MKGFVGRRQVSKGKEQESKEAQRKDVKELF